jgi:hypothetical protein
MECDSPHPQPLSLMRGEYSTEKNMGERSPSLQGEGAGGRGIFKISNDKKFLLCHSEASIIAFCLYFLEELAC